MIASDGAPIYVEWVTAEASMEGITELLAMLLWDTHALVANPLSLTRHNAHECQVCINWLVLPTPPLFRSQYLVHQC